MIEEGLPTHVIAYHNDIQNSKGTKHMVSISLKAGVPTYLNVKHWVDIELGMKQIEIDGPKKEKEVDLF